MPKADSSPKSVVFIENGKFLVPSIHDTLVDKAIVLISGSLLMANWFYPLKSLKDLPSVIPLGFNIRGEIRLAANKYLLLGIPLVSTLFMIRYANLAIHPEAIQYPMKVDGKNAKQIYCLGKTFSRVKCLLAQFSLLGLSYLLVDTPTSSVGIKEESTGQLGLRSYRCSCVRISGA